MRDEPMSVARTRARPSISVVVPAYNARPFIAETLEAILAQTLPPDEVIVVDDGSTDATLEELARFRADIKVVSQSNRGAGGAHTTGFSMAKGDYVARCDADDIWAPTKLERQSEALVTHPDVDIAFAGAQVFGRFEKSFLEFAGAVPPPTGVITDRRSFGRSLYRANMICSSSVVIRRELQRRLGPFDRLPNEDYEYWLRAARANALFFYDPTALVFYRQYGAGVSSNIVAMYEAAHLVHTRYEDLAGGRVHVRRALAADRFESALALIDRGRIAEARRILLASLRHWPTAQRLAWTVLLMAPERQRLALVGSIRSAKRARRMAAR